MISWPLFSLWLNNNVYQVETLILILILFFQNSICLSPENCPLRHLVVSISEFWNSSLKMAADGQVEEGPPLTELESLQLKANNITDDSLDSTRRMITLCEEVGQLRFWHILTKFFQKSFFNMLGWKCFRFFKLCMGVYISNYLIIRFGLVPLITASRLTKIDEISEEK